MRNVNQTNLYLSGEEINMNICSRDRWAICVGLEEVHGPPGKADFYSNRLIKSLA
jgi:hypothetical protein